MCRVAWLFILIWALNERAVFSDNRAKYDAEGKRDPFSPLISNNSLVAGGLFAVENIDQITITGIVYDPNFDSSVIVNGAVMKQGQQIGAVKLVKVEPNGAYFSINGVEAFKSYN